MRRTQFLALCATAFAGCYLGGFTAQIGPAKAYAQLQTYPPTGQPPQVRITSENSLFVPEGGLRMVNEQNRVLGVITSQGGNGGIVLFDSRGRPSVTILGGSAGSVELNASAGPGIRVVGPSGREGAILMANDTTASLRLRQGLDLTSNSTGGHMTLLDQRASATVKIESGGDGGKITGYDKSKGTVFELFTMGNAGAINLYTGKEALVGFTAKGDGSAKIVREKETVWQIPAEPKD